MNNHFENSFLQQLIDLMKNDESIFTLFSDSLFQKFFRGRNIIIKNNDIKYLIKYTINIYGPFYYFEKLGKFLQVKENGGARTTHQLNQAFSLMSYIIGISNNKIIEEEKPEFLSNFLTKNGEAIYAFGKGLNSITKENLKSETVVEEESKDDTDETNNNSKKGKNQKKVEKKNNSFFIGLTHFYEKYLNFLIKSKIEIKSEDKLGKNCKIIVSALEKGVESNSLKNLEKKITEMKEKVL